MRPLTRMLIVGSSLLAGCTAGAGAPCDMAVNPGVIVAVFDADSQPLAGASGYVFNQRGRTDFSTPPVADDNQLIAFVNAGNYEVVVEKPGYLSWHRADVHVIAGDGLCIGVTTVELAAQLEPAPS